ncbi:MAG: hypothetical protein PF450_05715 [Bacteroidales bacterium]|jgi:hypothetical protein|nr:hypothetical protein [Bacteroidales bacterium]
MDEKKAKSHVTLVAVLHIAFGALSILGAIITLIVFQFSGNFIPEDEFIAHDILTSLAFIIPGSIAIFGLIDLLAGVSLLSYKQWSRVFVIVVSAINCLNIPIGTAKGVYSIWELMQPEVQEMFE